MNHLSSDLFSQTIADYTGDEKMNFKNKKPVIIVFHHDKDNFTDDFIDIYDTYSPENEKIKVFEVIVNKFPEVADSYNITAFPATMYIPAGGCPIISQGYISTKDAIKDAQKSIISK